MLNDEECRIFFSKYFIYKKMLKNFFSEFFIIMPAAGFDDDQAAPILEGFVIF